MAKKKEIVVPSMGGLNSDDHSSVMPTNDSRYNLNCFDVRKGDHGRKRAIYGDTLVSTLTLGANESIVGGCTDVARDGHIYFIYDAVTYKTRIVRHKIATNAVESIIIEGQYETPAVLGVHTDVTKLYVDCTVIGDELVWTDGVYDVKSIVMDKYQALQTRITNRDLEDVEIIDGIYKVNGNPEVVLGCSNDITSWDRQYYVWFFDAELHREYGGAYVGGIGGGGIAIFNYNGADISLYPSNLGYLVYMGNADDIHYRGYEAYTHLRKPPLAAPQAEFTTETGASSVNLEYSYQFAYTYVYYDGTESVMSPFSNEVYYDLQADLPLDLRQKSIRVEWGVDSDNISMVRLYVRTIGNAISTFYLTYEFSITNKKTDVITYTFRGINALGVKTNEESYKVNEAIPYAAEAIESIKNNTLVLGGCTEGVESANDVKVSLSSSIKATGGAVLLDTKNATYNGTTDVLTVATPTVDGEYYFKVTVIDVARDGQFTLTYYFQLTLTYVKWPTESLNEFFNKVLIRIREKINERAYSSTTGKRISFDGENFVTTGSRPLSAICTECLGYEGIEQIKVYSASEGAAVGFKDNASHMFEVIYYDRLGRACGISKSFSVNVKPYLTQNYDTTGLEAYNWAGVAIEATVTGRPPLKAYKYQLAYARPSTYTEQFVTSYTHITNGDVAYSGDGDYDYEADPDMSHFKAIGIDALHIGQKKRAYQYVDGDLLRVVFKGKDKELVSLYFEVKIESAKTTAKGYSVVYINKYDWDNNLTAMFGSTTPMYVVFEIIRRSNVTDNRTFVAIGDTRPIGNYGLSNRYHLDNTITMIEGDVYNASIVGGEGVINGIHIENIHPSFDTLHSPRAYGKAFPAQINDSIKYRSIVRNSGKLFTEAKVNNLSVFNGLDYVEINAKHGNIYRLIAEGNVVSVLQKNNIASIYIGGREVATQEGTTEVYASDKVLGSVRDSASQYGIQCKAAAVKLDYGFAFYDHINQVVCRKYSTGIIPITGRFSTSEGAVDYKMSKHFKELSDATTIANPRTIRLGYDPYTRMLLVTAAGAATNKKTIAFSMDANRWTFFSDADYTQYYTYGNRLYGVSGGVMYRVLDPNSTTYPNSSSSLSVCEAVLTSDTPLTKIAEAITLYSKTRPTAVVTTDGGEQETLIKPVRWRKEENKFIAYIPKNYLPNRRTHLLEEGEQLQGKSINVQLTIPLSESMDVLGWEVWYTTIEY